MGGITDDARNQPRPSSTFARKVGLGFASIGASVLAIAVISILSLVVMVRHKDERARDRLHDLIAVHKLVQLAEKKIAAGRAHLVAGEPMYHDEVVQARAAMLAQIEALGAGADAEMRARLDAVLAAERRHHEAIESAAGGGFDRRAFDVEIKPLGDGLREMVAGLLARTDAAHDVVELEARELSEGAIAFIVVSTVIGLLAAAYLARWLGGRLVELYKAEQDAVRRQRAAHEELQRIIDALPVLVASIGPDERYRFVNRRYTEWFGRDDLQGRTFRDVLDHHPLAASRVEAAMAGEPATHDTRTMAAGQLRDLHTVYVPSRGANDEPGVVVLVTDLTEERRMRDRARLLAEISERLTSAGEVEDCLREVVELVVPELAAGAVLHLTIPGDPPLRIASGPDTEGAAETLAVPLRAHGDLFGTLELAAPPEQPFHPEDRDLADEIARRVALAVESARLHRATERALAARDEIVAVVSHDLRNPLGVILLRVEQLSRMVTDPAASRHVTSIEKAAERMESLIKTLLDASRIETRRLTVVRAPEDPCSIAHDAAEMMEALATEKSIRILVDTCAAPLVDADRDRVLQVLENLLGNAIKFSPPGSTVRIAVAVEYGEVVFCVEDNGPGVSERDAPRIFDRYFQGERKRRKGLGLGLYIARGIIEAHGGRIWIERAPRRGARFCFSLPRAGAATDTLVDEAAHSPDML
jgi:PAS domain S-box-containing protein